MPSSAQFMLGSAESAQGQKLDGGVVVVAAVRNVGAAVRMLFSPGARSARVRRGGVFDEVGEGLVVLVGEGGAKVGRVVGLLADAAATAAVLDDRRGVRRL